MASQILLPKLCLLKWGSTCPDGPRQNTSPPGSASPRTTTSRARRAPGRVLRSKTRKTHNRAAQAFRLAARSLIQSDSALGAFYRRLKGRIGPQQALTATAHKIARIYYAICKHRQPFEHVAAETYQQQFRERELTYLRRKAAKLGFALAPKPNSA
jgi:transposase